MRQCMLKTRVNRYQLDSTQSHLSHPAIVSILWTKSIREHCLKLHPASTWCRKISWALASCERSKGSADLQRLEMTHRYGYGSKATLLKIQNIGPYWAHMLHLFFTYTIYIYIYIRLILALGLPSSHAWLSGTAVVPVAAAWFFHDPWG